MPNSRDPNKRSFNIWFTEDEKEILREKAKAEGLSMSDFIKKRISDELKNPKED
jgi:uncharacterized protein (DUF1778 family)